MNVECPHCRASITIPVQNAGETANCPYCSGQFQIPYPSSTVPNPANPYSANAPLPPPESFGDNSQEYTSFVSKRLAAGICGIVLGGWGVHKFILGMNTAGAIMLAVSLIGAVTGLCLFVPIFLTLAMQVIGFIEGIIYLTMSDQQFYKTYANRQKEWF